MGPAMDPRKPAVERILVWSLENGAVAGRLPHITSLVALPPARCISHPSPYIAITDSILALVRQVTVVSLSPTSVFGPLSPRSFSTQPSQC